MKKKTVLLLIIIFITSFCINVSAAKIKDGWVFVRSLTNPSTNNWAYYENGKEVTRVSTMILVHKGWGTAPENSLAALRIAKENNYRGFEGDVRFTKDGIPVLSHDLYLYKVARKIDSEGNLLEIEDKTLRISDLTFNELNNYSFCISRNTVLEEYKDNKITKFEDAIKFAKDNKMLFKIELKEGTEDQISSVVKIVKKYDLDNRVIWSSTSYNLLSYVNKVDDDEYIHVINFQNEYDNNADEIYDIVKTPKNLVGLNKATYTIKEADVTLDFPEKLNDNPYNKYDVQTKSDFSDDSIYDVILFWGQSNMAGSCGTHICDDGKKEIEHIDSNLEELGANSYSAKTGISLDIISNYKAMGHVDVPLISQTAYEYLYNYDQLVELTKDTSILGENVFVTVDSKNYNSFGPKLTNVNQVQTFRISAGTNLIPWFSKQYYEKTGHKVIAVSASFGGKKINNFLPHSDSASTTTTDYTNDSLYLYEGMIEKYTAAIQYLENNNIRIGNKFHVVFQGENDAKAKTKDWDVMYNRIHKLLKDNLGLSFGVIIESSSTLANNYEGVELVHASQEKAIQDNDDVILGSSYSYDRYVPDEANYSGKFLNNTMSYDEALKQANLSVSGQCESNVIHFNSAALSQIGLETANNIDIYLESKKQNSEDQTIVNVEDTDSNVSKYYYIVGIIIVLIGGYIIVRNLLGGANNDL